MVAFLEVIHQIYNIYSASNPYLDMFQAVILIKNTNETLAKQFASSVNFYLFSCVVQKYVV